MKMDFFFIPIPKAVKNMRKNIFVLYTKRTVSKLDVTVKDSLVSSWVKIPYVFIKPNFNNSFSVYLNLYKVVEISNGMV